MRSSLETGDGMKHPCEQDCAERTAECKKTCPRWAVYAEAKKAEYAKRRMEYLIRDTEFKANERRTKAGCFVGSCTKPRHTGDRSRHK